MIETVTKSTKGNQCKTCRYAWVDEGQEGHCYMFKEEFNSCGYYRADRDLFPPAQEPPQANTFSEQSTKGD